MLIEQNFSASQKSNGAAIGSSIPVSPNRRMRNSQVVNVEEKGGANQSHVSGSKSFKTVFKLSQSGQKQQLMLQQ